MGKIIRMGEYFRRGFLEPSGDQPSLFDWIFSTDHKRIGLLYLYSISTFFAVGVTLGLLIRLELIAPGSTIVGPDTYNALFTLHGVVMIFLFIIPGIPAAFGNILLPLQIGARDVAFPRLNLFSWWLYIIGASMALSSLLGGGGPPDTGWTFYLPFAGETATNVSLAVFAVFILGFSSILTGLNFITTIHRMRAPGMTWTRLPLFIWSLYATAWVQVLATPILGITLLLILAERILGLGLFDAARGGDPLMYQHLFWIYSHPAVYIMVLPAMGVVSEIIPVFARRPIFGYKAIVASSIGIAAAGSLVWGHHMFVSGMSDTAILVFSLLTFIVAIPSAVKVFNWVATLYGGSIRLDAPMLFALSFVLLFSIGGLSGLVLGAAATDVHVHDTHFVVAHFHYVMFGGTGFAFFGALHYWFPKIFGCMYNNRRATWGWGIMIIGFNLLYFSMMLAGLRGMPRRYYDYLLQFSQLNRLATYGSWILAVGLMLMAANLLIALRRGQCVGANPWEAATLEWTVASPPPTENFAQLPQVSHGPYDFKKAGKP
ncbi:cytochrome c oxidase, coo3-type, cytochrome o subunit I [Syntrophotalea carbinolica DSM 2380]|uniref:Cytochrome c oxidase subunit 1 n=1 Tax=Syntrophotalea carbinolica (strain DSM 2380 / NBRC 103641 / GraBd1) TaxID=338963 RepID=Q3A1J3_SYNC1|nr:cytochrome c oxidase subunit I [Syntrophotalea carbinolica]ABA89764.2 cytochrome c oxidase, coo3-type, cytochrome o subunit I [Syntrophotalea carbinolica DSM 2380]